MKAIELIPYLDVTYLKEPGNQAEIIKLVDKILSFEIRPAAVCVHKENLSLLNQLSSPASLPRILKATVINFPHGAKSDHDIWDEVSEAIDLGCDEIDMVFPYQEYNSGRCREAVKKVEQTLKQCQPSKIALKVILETSEFPSPCELFEAAKEVSNLGVHFLKTSTGFSKHGATMEGVEILAKACATSFKTNGHHCGVKVSGGVSNLNQAVAYIHVITNILGDKWLSPKFLRVGASQLYHSLVDHAGKN